MGSPFPCLASPLPSPASSHPPLSPPPPPCLLHPSLPPPPPPPPCLSLLPSLLFLFPDAHPLPQVSKKHCRIWRDSRGNVYIQDLASTNGTKLNGEWLRPPSDAGSDSKAHSDPRRLSVGDIVILGLTTLRLNDGAAPEPDTQLERSDEAGAEPPTSPTGSLDGGGMLPPRS